MLCLPILTFKIYMANVVFGSF